MPDHGWKIGVCLFSLLASVVILLMGPPLKLGIDLSGGVILVYEVDQTKQKPGETGRHGQADRRRQPPRQPGGQKEVTIRKYGVEQIEIIVPEVEEAEVERIERIISRTGNLEFRILANNRDDKELIERAMAEPSKMQDSRSAEQSAGLVGAGEGRRKNASFASYRDIARRTAEGQGQPRGHGSPGRSTTSTTSPAATSRRPTPAPTARASRA